MIAKFSPPLLVLLLALSASSADTGVSLLEAVKAKNLPAIQESIAKGADLNALTSGTTPLVHSLDRGDAWDAVSEALLTLGASVEAPTSKGRTPLMAAAATGNVPMIKRLIEKRADTEASANDGTKSLTYAIGSGSSEAVETLLQSGASLTDDSANVFVLDAAYRGNFEITKLLLKHRANVNAANRWGWTALMNAAGKNLPKLVRLLLAHGADTRAAHEVENADSRNALCCAAKANALAAARVLLEHGMDPHWQNDTAIRIARGENHQEMLALLTGQPIPSSAPTAPPLEDQIAAEFPPGERWTVSLSSFVTDDNSWRSAQQAADFSALLQASLGELPEVTFVERDEIRRAESELGLQALGATNRADSLRIGGWLKSQFLVTGRFSADEGQGSTLVVEIIDLQRADILARRSRVIKMPPDEPFALTPADAKDCVPMVRAAIAEAASTKVEMAQQIVVAPLFFRNTSTSSDRLNFVEGDLMESFAKASTKGVRIARFPNAANAAGETELVIGGLVDADKEAWKRVADYYVWGDYQEQTADGLPFDEVPVELRLQIWDGASAPVEQVTKCKAGALNQAVASATAKALALTQTHPKGRSDTMRDQVAKSLRDRVTELRSRLSDSLVTHSAGWMQQWRMRRDLLELAHFLQPGDGQANAELLFERGNRNGVFWAAYEDYTPQQFQSLWQQSDEWRQHVQRHGFASLDALRADRRIGALLPFGPGMEGDTGAMPRANHFVAVAGAVLQHVDRKWGGYPDEMPWSVHQQWFQTLAEDLAARLGKVAKESPGDATIQPQAYTEFISKIHDLQLRADGAAALWKLSKHTSMPPDASATEKLKALVEKALRTAGRPNEIQGVLAYTAARRREGSGGLSRSVFVRESAHKMLLEGEELRVQHEKQLKESVATSLPGEVKLPMKAIPMDSEFLFSNGVDRLTYDRGRLVVTSDVQYRETLRQCSGVWISEGEPRGPKFLRELEMPHYEGCSAVIAAAGHLWLACNGQGVVRLNPANEVTRYSTRDGIVTDRFLSAAPGNGELFFGGGVDNEGRLAAYRLTTQKWTVVEPPADRALGRVISLAFSRDRLLVIDLLKNRHTLSLFHTMERTWHPVPMEKLSHDNVYSVGDDQGFWIGTQSRLMYLDAGSAGAPEDVHFDEPIPAKITSLLLDDDGKHLWLATSGRRPSAPMVFLYEPRIYCIDKASRRPVAFMRPPYSAPVTSLAVSQDKLWLSMQMRESEGGCVFELSKSGFINQ